MDAGSKSGLEAAPWLRLGTPHVPQQVWWLPGSAPKVILVQALAKHIEQLVALPDELRQTNIRRFKRLCDS